MSKETPETVVLEFDLELKELQVRLRNPNTKELEEYILKELDGMSRDSYLDFTIGKVKMDDNGKVKSMSSVNGLYTRLLSLCLYKKGSATPVPENEIKLWPATVISKLHEQAQKLSGLDEGAKEAAKNA